MLLSNLSGEMGDGFWEMQQECFRTADDVDICLDHSWFPHLIISPNSNYVVVRPFCNQSVVTTMMGFPRSLWLSWRTEGKMTRLSILLLGFVSIRVGTDCQNEAWSTNVNLSELPPRDTFSGRTLNSANLTQRIIRKAAHKDTKSCSYIPHHNRSYQGAIALTMPTQSQFEPIICVVGFHHARYFIPGITRRQC